VQAPSADHDHHHTDHRRGDEGWQARPSCSEGVDPVVWQSAERPVASLAHASSGTAVSRGTAWLHPPFGHLMSVVVAAVDVCPPGLSPALPHAVGLLGQDPRHLPGGWTATSAPSAPEPSARPRRVPRRTCLLLLPVQHRLRVPAAPSGGAARPCEGAAVGAVPRGGGLSPSSRPPLVGALAPYKGLRCPQLVSAGQRPTVKTKSSISSAPVFPKFHMILGRLRRFLPGPKSDSVENPLPALF
jgi:hypothetical protein